MVKKCQIGVPEMFFEKITRNITDTEKTLLANIIGNFVANNIVFGREVLAHQLLSGFLNLLLDIRHN